MLRTATRLHSTLPIFRLNSGDRSVLYAPGHSAVVSPAVADDVALALADEMALALADDAATALADEEALRRPARMALAAELQDCAALAAARWRALSEEPFEPECLTVYLSNRCNLGCAYCYAAEPDGGREPSQLPVVVPGERLPLIDEDTVRAAAVLVARCCARKQIPFHLVLHGGGEPTLHWSLLQRIVALTRLVAADHGIGWWGYLATHGVLSAAKAAWLAEHFDMLGLSCDGPPDIQNGQRPQLGGGGTSDAVERTAAVLAARGARFAVRATITPATVHRQPEMVTYFHERLAARDLRFEPVYRAGGPRQAGFGPEDAERFVRYFLEAQERAQSLGCELRISGVRLDEIHGPYCNVLRHTLHLTPDGSATACFLATDSRTHDDAPLAVGSLDRNSGEFVLDHERIAAMRRRATRIPQRCRDCVNIYHCVRDCADVCPVTEPEQHLDGPPGFKCLVQLQLAETWIGSVMAGEPQCIS